MMEIICEPIRDITKEIIVNKLDKYRTYIRDYNNNIEQLQKQYKQLEDEKQFIREKVDQGLSNSQRRTVVTDVWLDDVEKLMTQKELQELVNDENRKGKDQCCFGHFHYNMVERYKMSFNAKAKATEIQGLITKRPPADEITQPKSRRELKLTTSEFSKNLSCRVNLMENILDKLKDDQVNSVGIFGMGAIGKTTLVKEIANNQGKTTSVKEIANQGKTTLVKEIANQGKPTSGKEIANQGKTTSVKEIANQGATGMFDDIVIAEISEAPSVERIQYQIAEQLGLTLHDHSLDTRANNIHDRLMLRKEGDKKRTILVILDNLWETFDYGIVGIPKLHENTEKFCCKLLITSRKKDVCEAMGVSMNNIIEVHTLDDIEAKQLFRERVGRIIHDLGIQQEEMEKRLLKKCGGLPLAIVALADVLKGKELSNWEQFATELEKSTRSQSKISDVHRNTYSILETSYKLIESEEIKMFLLLACLFPPGSSISVEEMMRNGIGLGLFQHVNNLTEALAQANKWVHELISSSLLLKDDCEGQVKIYDIVRESIISVTQKEERNMLMVDAFPRWMWEETCQKYSAMSLRYPSDHSRLSELNSLELQVLILDGTQPKDRFPSNFFQGMPNLKVLVLKGMDFTSGLPNSIRNLKRNLRVLHLEDCELGEIGDAIGELTNLLILGLRKSRMNEEVKFPADAMRKLSKLCLLDLSEWVSKGRAIPAKVLSSLSQLEGLYLFDSVEKWETNNIQKDNGTENSPNDVSIEIEADGDVDRRLNDGSIEIASIDELNKLNYLKVVEMQMSNLQQFPIDEKADHFVRNLDKFFISINTSGEPDSIHFRTMFSDIDYMPKCYRTLSIKSVDVNSTLAFSCLEAMLKKSDGLYLHDVKNLDHLFDHHLNECNLEGVKGLIIYENMMNFPPTRIAFPNLEFLCLIELPNLKNIHHSQATFSKLRGLCLSNLLDLEPYALPINVLCPHLARLEVEDCPKLKFIFGKENENEYTNIETVVGIHPFPSLRILALERLGIKSMLEVSNPKFPCTTTDNEEPKCIQVLFNEELILPALEVVQLDSLCEIVTLWDVQRVQKDNYVSFCNLKELDIDSCDKLESLGPLSLAAPTLMQLKTLEISSCKMLTKGITINDDDMTRVTNSKTRCHQQIPNSLPLFQSLETLTLMDCEKIEIFLEGKQSKVVIEFASLEELCICNCPKMQSFSFGTFRAPKLRQFEFDNLTCSKQQSEDINQFLQTPYKPASNETTEQSTSLETS